MIKICLVGEGAQGDTHMKALQEMKDVEVITLAGGIEADMHAFAKKWQIPHCSTNLAECLGQPGVDAVINTGPSQLHVEQTRLCFDMGKHVLLEIPMALDIKGTEELVKQAQDNSLVGMVCHTRHFGAGLIKLKKMIDNEELHLHHIICQTYFFRRVNINRFGQARSWKDNLLWHHACHAVDMVRWLLDDDEMEVWGQTGSTHPKLNIPMDLSVGMRSEKNDAIATMALSFNNHGEILTPMRFIGEQASYMLEAGTLKDHEGNIIVQGTMEDAVVNQNNEFINSIRDGYEPETSFARSLGSMRYLHDIQKIIDKESC